MTVTNDLSNFGYRELDMAGDLLKAYANNRPDFLYSKVEIFSNSISGYVFLSDEYYNVGIMKDDKLVQFFSCDNCGEEGTNDENAHDKPFINHLCWECHGQEEHPDDRTCEDCEEYEFFSCGNCGEEGTNESNAHDKPFINHLCWVCHIQEYHPDDHTCEDCEDYAEPEEVESDEEEDKEPEEEL